MTRSMLVLVLNLYFLALFGVSRAAAADSQPVQADVPRGEVSHHTFEQSKVFPGTFRDYWIYVPRQYNPKRPACLFVCQDGIQFKAPSVFDRLIHQKEMPVTIGVFINPGRVKARSDRALDRFNRSFEYDSLGDRYVRFLQDELLPDVEKKNAADGRPLRLSQAGNDRCIAGLSSGAICAFTAAWERPQAFARVFSAIGTYVGLRGGNAYPTLIRKLEPKPIRVFLEDGSNDLNIYGGDWWMANQEMERALKFAGYEVNHSWGDGPHNGNHATEIFTDAMRWLWKDWPHPIKTGTGSPHLQQILSQEDHWQVAARGYHRTGGLACSPEGEIVFADFHDGKNYRMDVDGKVTVLPCTCEPDKGQAFSPDGRLHVYDRKEAGIIALDSKGSSRLVGGVPFCNDLVVAHNGKIYFTGSVKVGDTLESRVSSIAPDGNRLGDTTAQHLQGAGGITLSPDQSLLYVAESKSHWITSYQVGSDGALNFRQRFFHLHVPDDADDSGAGTMHVDREGRLYVATRMGIQVCDQPGRVNAIIPGPEGAVSSLCFGGRDFTTLFVTSGGTVYKRKVKVRGANAFEAPHKPPTPQL